MKNILSLLSLLALAHIVLGQSPRENSTFTTSNARTGQPIEVRNFDQPKASFVVPTSRVMPPGTGTIHIILAVTDHGTPRLTRYQRVIVTVEP